MHVLKSIRETLPEGEVEKIVIGLNWTAAIVRVGGERRCGLASSVVAPHEHGVPIVPDAGNLERFSTGDLTGYAGGGNPTMGSVGMAVMNALLPVLPRRYEEINAGEVIARLGRNRRGVLGGHFPFIDDVRHAVGTLDVVEKRPAPGEVPADQAHTVIPDADVIALTSMTLINGTFDGLMELRKPGAEVLLLGPSTPLSPVFADAGVGYLSGSIVTNIDRVVSMVCQGASFRQIVHGGVSLVTMKLKR